MWLINLYKKIEKNTKIIYVLYKTIFYVKKLFNRKKTRSQEKPCLCASYDCRQNTDYFAFTSSKMRTSFSSGALVSRDTATLTSRAMTKAGSSS